MNPPNNIPLHKYYISFHVYHIQLIKEEINYLYATLFSPAISTFITAITLGYFTTFPNLTTVLVKKYLTKTIFSAKFHLDQQYKTVDLFQKSKQPHIMLTINMILMTLHCFKQEPMQFFDIITTFDNYLPTK